MSWTLQSRCGIGETYPCLFRVALRQIAATKGAGREGTVGYDIYCAYYYLVVFSICRPTTCSVGVNSKKGDGITENPDHSDCRLARE